jgi:16S rRNA pseudouridine516 synthase
MIFAELFLLKKIIFLLQKFPLVKKKFFLNILPMDDFFTEPFETILIRRGISTHRRVRRLLQKQNFALNGKRILNPRERINLFADNISADEKNFPLAPDVYLMMNKAAGSVCTKKNSANQKNVYDFVPQKIFSYIARNSLPPLHTVGRLDASTEGLLLFTTNGDFSHAVSNPIFHVAKTYFVQLENSAEISERNFFCRKCAEGFFVPAEKNEHEFFSRPSRLIWLSKNSCTLTLTEGKFHQVKRMIKTLGNHVVYLKRISMGSLFLDENLKSGETKILFPHDIQRLFR